MIIPSTLSDFIFHCVVFRDIMILWMLVIWMKMAICMFCLELMMWSMLLDTEFQQVRLKRLALPDNKIEEWEVNKASFIDPTFHHISHLKILHRKWESHFLSPYFVCISILHYPKNVSCFRFFLLTCFPET